MINMMENPVNFGAKKVTKINTKGVIKQGTKTIKEIGRRKEIGKDKKKGSEKDRDKEIVKRKRKDKEKGKESGKEREKDREKGKEKKNNKGREKKKEKDKRRDRDKNGTIDRATTTEININLEISTITTENSQLTRKNRRNLFL